MAHGIIWWIVVGLIAGWAAGRIMKGGGYGVIADILLGIVGGIVGGWVVGTWFRQRRFHLEHRSSNFGSGCPDLDYEAHQEGSLRLSAYGD